MGQSWFYELSGQQMGPISESLIEALVAEGQLTASDRVRPADAEDWMTVDEMSSANSNATELSDLSELSFSFAESTASSLSPAGDADEDPDALDIDTFTVAGNDDASIHDGGLDINAFEIESGAAEGGTTVSADNEELAPAYFAKSLGHILGPMPLDELIAMAESGALSATDSVRADDEEEWFAAGDIEELSVAFLITDHASEADATTIGSVTARRLETDATVTADSETTSEASEAQSQSPAVTSSRVASEDSEGDVEEPRDSSKRSRRKSGKRKKKKKEDALLQEIFSEVFTEDGQVREDRSPTLEGSAAPTTTPVTVSPAASISQPPFHEPSTAAAPSPPTTSPEPSFKPPKTPKRRASGGISLPSVPLPDGKVLGIVGAVAAIVAGVFFGGSLLGPPRPDIEAFVESAITEYRGITGETIDTAAWSKFSSRVKTEGEAVRDYYNANTTLSPEETNLRTAAFTLLALSNLDPDEKELLDNVSKSLEKAAERL